MKICILVTINQGVIYPTPKPTNQQKTGALQRHELKVVSAGIKIWWPSASRVKSSEEKGGHQRAAIRVRTSCKLLLQTLLCLIEELFSPFLKYLVPIKGKHQIEWFLLLSCYCFLFLMRRSFKLWAGSMNEVTRSRGSPWTIPGKTSLSRWSSWVQLVHCSSHNWEVSNRVRS